MADKAGVKFGRDGTISAPGQLSGWKVVGFADLNHDGHPDMLLESTKSASGRQLLVWYLTGGHGNAFLASASLGPLSGWSVAGIADLNHDGNPDILWQKDGTHQVSIWYLNPAGLPQSYGSIDTTSPSGLTIAGVSDLNGDGHPDIVWQNDSASRVEVWYMNGDRVLRSAAIQTSGTAGGQLIVPSQGATGQIVTLAPAPLDHWNGINYSPRYHSYFRMLKDWNQYDRQLGAYVYQAADDDMEVLSRNGYNLLHLYLWDKRLLDKAVLNRWCPVDPESQNRPAGCTPPYSEPAGFPNFPDSLTSTPDGASQLAALQDFVARAEKHGLYVALHFASGTLLDQIDQLGRLAPPPPEPTPSCEAAAAPFGVWAGQFIAALTPVHRNVLLWGVAFAFGADATNQTDLHGEPSFYNRCFGQVYQTVDAMARKNAPPGTAGILGLIGVNPAFYFVTPPAAVNGQFARPTDGYAWDVATTQRVLKTMTDELTALYHYPKSPDIYMFSFYNPNAADLARNLQTLIDSNGGDPERMMVPRRQIFPIEFAISSPGTRSDAWGDSETPTTSVTGQDAWLNNTLCAFRSVGIDKFAYWAMYDASSLWMNAPWYNSGQQLSWNGYWGLAFERPSSP